MAMIKTTLLIVLFSSITLASGWKSQRQYTFSINGRNLAGLPELKQQYTGIEFNGKLLVYAHDATTFICKFANMTYTKLHEDSLPDWWSGETATQENRKLPLVSTGFAVQLERQAKVKKVIIPPNLSDWELNFIKGVIYHLVTSTKINRSHERSKSSNSFSRSDSTENLSDSFTTMEESITGKCEVLYDIVKIPQGSEGLDKTWNHPLKKSLCNNKNLYAITRTRNYSNCEFLAETHFAFPYTSQESHTPGSNSFGNFWERSSLTRFIGCEDTDGFLLLESVSSSSMSANIQFQENNKAVINSKLNITLLHEGDEKDGFKLRFQNTQYLKNMAYSYNPNRKSSYESCKFNNQNNDSTSSSVFGQSSKNAFNLFPKNRDNNLRNKDENSQDNNDNENNNADLNNRNKRSKGSKSSENINRRYSHKSSRYGDDYYDNNHNNNNNNNNNPWNLRSSGMNDPPHLPFTPFAISYSEPDVRNCLVQNFQDAIQQISNDYANKNVLVEEGTMEKISIAVDMCQMLSYKELLQVSDSLSLGSYKRTSNHDNFKRSVLRDVIVICGTKPSLALIAHWVKDEIFSDNELFFIFTTLPARLVSGDKETVNFYFDLVMKVLTNSDKQVATAAVIGFSNYARIACMNENSRANHFNPNLETICKPDDVEHYISQILDFKKSIRVQNDNKMLRVLSMAVGNLGHKSAIKLLKSMAENSDLSHYQRSNAIISMKYLSVYYPEDTAPVLFGIYSNYSMPVPVRLSAVTMLIYSQPTLSMWQRLAISTWYEPNLAVTSFIQSTISSLSDKSRQRCEKYKNLANAASSVQHMMRPVIGCSHKAIVYNIIESTHNDEFDMTDFQQSSWSGSADLMSIYHRHLIHSGLFSSNYEAEFSTANPDGLLSGLKLIFGSPKKDITQARPPNRSYNRSTSWIHDTLGLVTRRPSALEGDLHVKINNIIETVLPFDRKTGFLFTNLGKKFVSEVIFGINHSFEKTDMSSTVLSTTTELGLPVRLQLRVPWVLQTKAYIKGISRSSMHLGLSLKFSSGMNNELGFYTPWDNIAYITGIHGSCFGQIPQMNFTVQIDKDTSSVLINSDEVDESKLFYHSTYPFTAQKDLQTNQLITTNAETHIIHVGKLKQKNISPCPHLSGVYRTEGKINSLYQIIQHLTTLKTHPNMMHSNKLTHLEFTMKKMPKMSMNFTLGKATKEDGELITDRDYSKYNGGDGDYDSNDNDYGYSPDNEQTDSNSETQNNENEQVGFWTRMWRKIFGKNKPTTESPVSSYFTTITTPAVDLDIPSSTTESYENSQTNTTGSATTSYSNTTENRTPYEQVTSSYTSTSTKSSTHARDGVKSDNNYMDQVVHESLYYENKGDMFNASLVDPFTNSINGSSRLYILHQALQGVKNGKAFVLALNLTFHKPETQNSKYRYFWTYGTTNSKSLQRVGIFMAGNNTKWQNGLTATYEAPSLPAFNLEKVIMGETEPTFNVDVFKQNDDQKISLAIQGSMKQKATDFGLTKDVEQCQKPKSAPVSSCRRLFTLGTSFSDINLNVTVNDDTKSYDIMLKNFVDMTVVARNNFIKERRSKPSDLKNDESDNGDNMVQLSAMIDKENMQYNLWINTSTVDTNFRGMPLQVSPMVNTAVSLYKELMQQNSQFCGLANDRIMTFDGVKIYYNMTDCWHVAVKDVSGKSRIVILTRALRTSTYLDLEVNLDNYKILRITEDGINVNNEKISVSPNNVAATVSDKAGTTLLRIEQTIDYGYNILIPAHGFRVIYSNTSAVVYAYSGMQNRLSGLCGDYNFETFGEFRNPRNRLVNSAQNFGLSYSLNDENCVKLA